MSLNIAFIGFGEVGQLFTQQFVEKPDVEVTVYDILFDDPKTGVDLKRRAADYGARAADNTVRACRNSRLVISAVTADSAVSAAQQAAPALGPSYIYIDLNSVSPTTKRGAADQACRAGAGFVEFAVMVPVGCLGSAVVI